MRLVLGPEEEVEERLASVLLSINVCSRIGVNVSGNSTLISIVELASMLLPLVEKENAFADKS